MYQWPIMIACEQSMEAVALESSAGTNICAVSLWWIERSRDHESVILAPAAHLDCHKPHRVQEAKQRCPLECNRMPKHSSTTKRIFVRSVTNFVIGDEWFCSVFKLKMGD